MKQLMVVLTAAVLTSGCAPFLYPRPYGYPVRARVQPAPAPVPVGRWDAVMRLPRAATIDVLTRDGVATVGSFLRATSDNVRVLIGDTEKNIDRAAIVRVDLVDLPGSEAGAVAKSALKGGLLGAGVGVLVGAVVGGEMWPPPGLLVRGLAAGAGFSAGHGTFVQRQGRLIYLAEKQ